MNFPAELRYTSEHEWVKIDGDIATIGITEFAQRELGDIVYLDVNTVGNFLGHGEVFGVIEAVKTVSDLFMPLTGEVVELNPGLTAKPELVNSDPYGEGWIIKIRIGDAAQVSALLSADQYKKMIGE